MKLRLFKIGSRVVDLEVDFNLRLWGLGATVYIGYYNYHALTVQLGPVEIEIATWA